MACFIDLTTVVKFEGCYPAEPFHSLLLTEFEALHFVIDYMYYTFNNNPDSLELHVRYCLIGLDIIKFDHVQCEAR